MALKALINPDTGKALVNPSNGKALLKYTADPVETSFGLMYNGHAAQHADMMPTDWKVPTYAEWLVMLAVAGYDGGALKIVDDNEDYWLSPNLGAIDTYGFAAVGGGIKNNLSAFAEYKNVGYHWASDLRSIEFYSSTAGWGQNSRDENYGFSIRGLYEGAGTPTSVTDIEGNVYDVVLIGTQYWTVQNWKCTKLNTGVDIANLTDATWNTTTDPAYDDYLI